MRILVVMTLLTLALSFVMGQSQSGRLPGIIVMDEKESLVEILKTDGRFDITAIDPLDGQGRLDAINQVEEGWKSAFIEVETVTGDAEKSLVKITTIEQGMVRLSLKQAVEQALAKLDRGEAVVSAVESVMIDGGKVVEADKTSLHARLVESYERLSSGIQPYSIRIESFAEGIGAADASSRNVFFGMLLMFASHTIVFGVGEILSDKEKHVLQRLLVSGVPRWKLILSYVLVAWLYGMSQVSILLVGGKWLFGFMYGISFYGFLVLSIFILAMATLGLFIVALSDRHAQMSVVASVILTPAAMLGGCFWPLEIVRSEVLLALSWLMPHRYAMSALTDAASGVSTEIVTLSLMAGVFGVAGAWILGRRMEKMA